MDRKGFLSSMGTYQNYDERFGEDIPRHSLDQFNDFNDRHTHDNKQNRYQPMNHRESACVPQNNSQKIRKFSISVS